MPPNDGIPESICPHRLAFDSRALGQPDAQKAAATGDVIDREAALTRLAAAVAVLVDYAAPQGVGILLENNVVTRRQLADGGSNPLLLCDPEDVAAFLDAIGRADVGLLLDVGHAKVAGAALGFDPVDFFDLCGDQIRALHLSDNDGLIDQNAPIATHSWFMPHLRDVADRPMVVEAYRLRSETMIQQIEIVERAVV